MKIRTQWLRFLMVLLQLHSTNSTTCTKTCPPGYISVLCTCVCDQGYFAEMRNEQSRCSKCNICSAEKNLVEVTACTNTTDRQCHCKPGFFCPSPVKQYCRRTCQPCTDGFLSMSSLKSICQPFTNCASLNLIVIKEGSATQDRQCGMLPTSNPTTSKSLLSSSELDPETTSNPATSSEPRLSTTSHPSTTSEPMESVLNTVHASKEPEESKTSSVMIDTLHSTSHPKLTLNTVIKHLATSRGSRSNHQSQVTSHSSQPLQQNTTVSATPGGNIQPSEHPKPLSDVSGPPTWVVLLLLIVVLLMMLSCLCIWCKGKALKKKLEWSGLTFGKNQLQHWQKQQFGHSPETSGSDVESSILLSSNATNNSQNQLNETRLCPGGNQQVTVGHNGNGESISNTVGSIFIYSPGMVILGSNSKERKPETEENGEEIALMSVPQQESNSQFQEDAVGVGMQEEFGKDLNFPVPATGK